MFIPKLFNSLQQITLQQNRSNKKIKRGWNTKKNLSITLNIFINMVSLFREYFVEISNQKHVLFSVCYHLKISKIKSLATYFFSPIYLSDFKQKYLSFHLIYNVMLLLQTINIFITKKKNKH